MLDNSTSASVKHAKPHAAIPSESSAKGLQNSVSEAGEALLRNSIETALIESQDHL